LRFGAKVKAGKRSIAAREGGLRKPEVRTFSRFALIRFGERGGRVAAGDFPW
jgi:hypothetical protein